MADLVWGDILDHVAEVHGREGAQPNRTFYRRLASQALAQISRLAGPFYTQWDNTTLTGALTITGGICPMPSNFVSEDSVYWDEVLMPYKSREQLDALDNEWRTAEGTPYWYTKSGKTLMFSSIPTGSVSGLLVVNGYGYLPTFSDTEGATNPLSYLSDEFQLLPAYYVLAMLPAHKKLLTDAGKVIGVDDSQIQRKAEYAALWSMGLQDCIWAIKSRELRPANFG